MGCCQSCCQGCSQSCCRPFTELEQDPTISFYTTVGDFALVREDVTRFIKTCCDGVMYVKGENLVYEAKCCCCKCCRQSIALSGIEKVEVVQNALEWYDASYSIFLSPGLKVHAGQNTIIVAMPDAAAFAKQLLQACNLSKDVS